jgi:hypothetical protein
MWKRLTLVAVFVALFAISASALATIHRPATTIDSGKVGNGGKRVEVRGHLTCTSGEMAFLRVTVTQRSTGAVAVKDSGGTCTGKSQIFDVTASSVGAAHFARRKAKICALARTLRNTHATDALQWCKTVRLS